MIVRAVFTGHSIHALLMPLASYVIVRGLTLKNSAEHGIVLGDVDHVVIEGCDISGWGKVASDTKFDKQ